MKGRFRPPKGWRWSLWMAALVVASQAFGPGVVMPSPLGWEMSGHVGYYAAGEPVPGVDLDLSNGAPLVDTTDADGNYSFTGLTTAGWTLQPAKQGDIGDAIGHLDASHALQAVVGLQQADGLRALACDVTGDGTALSACWNLLHPEIALIEVSGGSLRVQPTASGNGNVWFADSEGPLVYREITGDFEVTTIAHARDPNDVSQPPPPQFRLGGLLVRDPASSAGDRNSVHVVVGGGDNANPVSVEDKTTDGSSSDFLFYPVASADVELRITRAGSLFGLYYRAVGGPTWILTRSHDRPDLPATVHVGLMAYSTPAPPDVTVAFEEIVFGP
jgi:hypothetical protein